MVMLERGSPGVEGVTDLQSVLSVPALACARPFVSWQCFVRGHYGTGHTVVRKPGAMRGAVIGIEGRFRDVLRCRGGER
jgi:hypothetical protein